MERRDAMKTAVGAIAAAAGVPFVAEASPKFDAAEFDAAKTKIRPSDPMLKEIAINAKHVAVIAKSHPYAYGPFGIDAPGYGGNIRITLSSGDAVYIDGDLDEVVKMFDTAGKYDNLTFVKVMAYNG